MNESKKVITYRFTLTCECGNTQILENGKDTDSIEMYIGYECITIICSECGHAIVLGGISNMT